MHAIQSTETLGWGFVHAGRKDTSVPGDIVCDLYHTVFACPEMAFVYFVWCRTMYFSCAYFCNPLIYLPIISCWACRITTRVPAQSRLISKYEAPQVLPHTKISRLHNVNLQMHDR